MAATSSGPTLAVRHAKSGGIGGRIAVEVRSLVRHASAGGEDFGRCLIRRRRRPCEVGVRDCCRGPVGTYWGRSSTILRRGHGAITRATAGEMARRGGRTGLNGILPLVLAVCGSAASEVAHRGLPPLAIIYWGRATDEDARAAGAPRAAVSGSLATRTIQAAGPG